MGYTETVNTVKTNLNETFNALDKWFDQSATVLDFKFSQDSWTIFEILEHVTLTSHFLLLVIRKGAEKSLKRAATNPEPVEGESNLNILEPIGHPDAFGWLRPEHMEPTRTKTIAEVRQTMHEQYNEGLAILTRLANGEGALHKVRMSVQDLGKLDMYQWLYFLALHARRHLTEIERIYTVITTSN